MSDPADIAVRALRAEDAAQWRALRLEALRTCPTAFAMSYEESSLQDRMDEIRRELRLGDKVVGVGVDRLDYTKGIPERIGAIAAFLEERPDLVGRFVFVQIGVASRSEVPGYAEISAEIDGLKLSPFAGRPCRPLVINVTSPVTVSLT